MKGMTALVAGATGLVGSELVQMLLAAPEYDRVIVWGRRQLGITHEKLQEEIIHFEQLGRYAIPPAVDTVFCCLGTTIKKAKTREAFWRVDVEYPLILAQQAQAAGIQQLVVISAMGANAQSRIFYNRAKGEMERAICEVGLPGLHIVRPSLLLGARQEFRLGERVAALLLPHLPFGWSRRWQAYQPIAAQTVARAMLRIAGERRIGTHRYSSTVLQELGRS